MVEGAGIRESSLISPEPSKKTVLYGIGRAGEAINKQLGPKAWEQRVDNAISTYIIPHVSPEMRETIETYKPEIAKWSGWAITGAEVAVVAAATYGGIRLVVNKLHKRHVPTPNSPVPVTPDLHIRSDAKEWWERIRMEGDIPEDDSGLDLLRKLSAKKPAPPPVFVVGPDEVPSWLRELAGDHAPAGAKADNVPDWVQEVMHRRTLQGADKVPDFLRKISARNHVSQASEAAASDIGSHTSRWWQDRAAAGLDTSVLHTVRKIPKPRTRSSPSSVPIKDLPVHTRIYFDKKKIQNIFARRRSRRIRDIQNQVRRVKERRFSDLAHPIDPMASANAVVQVSPRAEEYQQLLRRKRAETERLYIDDMRLRQEMRENARLRALEKKRAILKEKIDAVRKRMGEHPYAVQMVAPRIQDEITRAAQSKVLTANPVRSEQQGWIADQLREVMERIHEPKVRRQLDRLLIAPTDLTSSAERAEVGRIVTDLFQAVQSDKTPSMQATVIQRGSQWVSLGMPGLHHVIDYFISHRK